VFQETNGGQIAAMNRTWPLARFPILMFLDADDVLFPHAAATVARVWTAATVKAQFPLETIDEEGRPLGHRAPEFPRHLDTATIRAALLHAGQSPSSPGSGNAYSLSLLRSLSADGGFDVENLQEHHMDAVLECNAPFYGDVATIHEPLAYRRIHGGNLYAVSAVDASHFAMMSRAYAVKLDYLSGRCRKWRIPFDPAVARNRSVWQLECRLAAAKLAFAKDPSREPILNILSCGIKACMRDPGPMTLRIARMLWFVSLAAASRGLARRLIALRFLVGERPRWVKRLFGGLFKFRRFAWLRPSSLSSDISRSGGTLEPQHLIADRARIRVSSR
jgi:hypothetical protein